MEGYAQFQQLPVPMTMMYNVVESTTEQEQEQQQEEDVEDDAAMGDVMGDAFNIKQKNTLPIYGNKETMNINPMILSNIQGSAYFKEDLYKMKTFHEVIDEIFYKVSLRKFCVDISTFRARYRWNTWSRGRKEAEN